VIGGKADKGAYSYRDATVVQTKKVYLPQRQSVWIARAENFWRRVRQHRSVLIEAFRLLTFNNERKRICALKPSQTTQQSSIVTPYG